MQPQQLVTISHVEEYAKNGHICMRNIIDPKEFAEFREQMNAAIDKVKQAGDKQQRIDDYSHIFTQVTNIWKVDPQTAKFILDSRFGAIAAKLLGVEKVRLYHDQALVKFPKASKTPWHQDCFYWPVDSSKMLTMWLPLHDCPRQMGTMLFATGSHRDQTVDPRPISETSEEYYDQVVKEKNFKLDTYDLQAGDATFHSSRTIHCAYPNGEQNRKREVITVIYMEDGAKVMPEHKLNDFRKVDLKVFCPGVKPEEEIKSQLNPLIN